VKLSGRPSNYLPVKDKGHFDRWQQIEHIYIFGRQNTIFRMDIKRSILLILFLGSGMMIYGKIIQDYYVYATPTFLLLDQNLRIKAKPTGLAELKDALQK